jgi:hypothetical protein
LTLYAIMLSTSGLSQREAAEFHEVAEESVYSWCRGRRRAPDGIIDELHELIARQQAAADEAASVIEKNLAAKGTPETIDIGVCTDDHEAQSLGWPTASAHAAVIGKTLAQIIYPVIHRIRIVPRGSTAASAAAADQNF